MGKAKLIELLSPESEEKPFYRFDELDKNQRVDELSCYGYNEKSSGEWRDVALKEVDNVRFVYELFTMMPSFSRKSWEINGNITTIAKKEEDCINKMEELKFWNYHNPKKLKKYLIERGGLWDTLSLVYGGLSLSWKAFALFQLIGELGRRRGIGNEKSRLKRIRAGIEKYENLREGIQNARIKVYTPEEAVEIIREVEKVDKESKYISLDFRLVNEDLIKVYSQY